MEPEASTSQSLPKVNDYATSDGQSSPFPLALDDGVVSVGRKRPREDEGQVLHFSEEEYLKEMDQLGADIQEGAQSLEKAGEAFRSVGDKVMRMAESKFPDAQREREELIRQVEVAFMALAETSKRLDAIKAALV